jgi:hypothetical protein
MRLQSFPSLIFSIELIFCMLEMDKINITRTKGVAMWVKTEMRVCVCVFAQEITVRWQQCIVGYAIARVCQAAAMPRHSFKYSTSVLSRIIPIMLHINSFIHHR